MSNTNTNTTSTPTPTMTTKIIQGLKNPFVQNYIGSTNITPLDEAKTRNLSTPISNPR
jgi:hypothetical protein